MNGRKEKGLPSAAAAISVPFMQTIVLGLVVSGPPTPTLTIFELNLRSHFCLLFWLFFWACFSFFCFGSLGDWHDFQLTFWEKLLIKRKLNCVHLKVSHCHLLLFVHVNGSNNSHYELENVPFKKCSSKTPILYHIQHCNLYAQVLRQFTE